MARLDDLPGDLINEDSLLSRFQSFQRSFLRDPSEFLILHGKAIEFFTDRAREGSVFWYRLSHIRLPSFALFPPLRFTFLGFVQNRAHFAKCSHAVLDAGDILLGENICIVGEV
jgi:hypothetical protein